ncbi:calcium uptake protein 3, mitochondrial isoform X1 [Microplitis demolitor]|uniref:calcium uptake protein 3, mitochondrial isoform X1 n=1 Tax=Microplitis demolitor TaxID=69319 RepID=UPI0004CCF7E9|nr:calcium uptake protein 3, mitochondrial isoform X1 [Microplitis demolitor]
MANITRRLFRPLKNSYSNIVNSNYSFKTNHNVIKFIKTSAGLIAIGGIVLYAGKKYHSVNVVYAAARPRKREDELPKAVKLTMRERRFIKFASVEFNGQLYMTPQDFLDSIVECEPRPRYKRRVLTNKDLEMIKNTTPLLQRGNSHMFRNLKDKGIISYTEYLFLLSILTKPQTGFRIAFNMFDTDGNEIVDKNEFLVMRKLFGSGVKDRELNETTARVLQKLVTPSEEMTLAMKTILRDSHENSNSSKSENTSSSYMEKIFSHAWKGRHGGNVVNSTDELVSDDSVALPQENDEGLQRRHAVDTTIMIHFFGKDGTKELKYDGFRQFMENLQHEVLELEFQEFSKGSDTISELDFAKILLRYTDLDTDEYDKYLGRLLERSERHEDINFPEFRLFYQFLNSLEDFAIAMRMYTLADHPISKEEFRRAVKICTGTNIPMHIIETVFAIFDVDGDGQLSYKEFIAIMKDRLHRGFKTQPRNEGWESFKFCVKQELKAP